MRTCREWKYAGERDVRGGKARGGAEDVTGSFHSGRPGISEECSQLGLSSSYFRPRPAGA